MLAVGAVDVCRPWRNRVFAGRRLPCLDGMPGAGDPALSGEKLPALVKTSGAVRCPAVCCRKGLAVTYWQHLCLTLLYSATAVGVGLEALFGRFAAQVRQGPLGAVLKICAISNACPVSKGWLLKSAVPCSVPHRVATPLIPGLICWFSKTSAKTHGTDRCKHQRGLFFAESSFCKQFLCQRYFMQIRTHGIPGGRCGQTGRAADRPGRPHKQGRRCPRQGMGQGRQ